MMPVIFGGQFHISSADLRKTSDDETVQKSRKPLFSDAALESVLQPLATEHGVLVTANFRQGSGPAWRTLTMIPGLPQGHETKDTARKQKAQCTVLIQPRDRANPKSALDADEKVKTYLTQRGVRFHYAADPMGPPPANF